MRSVTLPDMTYLRCNSTSRKSRNSRSYVVVVVGVVVIVVVVVIPVLVVVVLSVVILTIVVKTLLYPS